MSSLPATPLSSRAKRGIFKRRQPKIPRYARNDNDGWSDQVCVEGVRPNRLRLLTTRAIALVLAVLAAGPATAMTMRIDGHTVILSGSVVGTECTALDSLLSKNHIDTVVLNNSGGGDATTGYCVGALIRDHGLSTVIRGRCASSCSRMWLGGVERTLEGPHSKVGLHGNYSSVGGLDPGAPQRLRTWIPHYAPAVDRALMEKWIHLPSKKWMMYFYNDRAELCDEGTCSPLDGRTALSVGLATK